MAAKRAAVMSIVLRLPALLQSVCGSAENVTRKQQWLS